MYYYFLMAHVGKIDGVESIGKAFKSCLPAK